MAKVTLGVEVGGVLQDRGAGRKEEDGGAVEGVGAGFRQEGGGAVTDFGPGAVGVTVGACRGAASDSFLEKMRRT